VFKIHRQFLESFDGQKSSKRLCILVGLVNWVILTWITAITLLAKNQNELVVSLIESVGLMVFGLGGLVASEFFSKRKYNESEKNGTTDQSVNN
jgi:hypothetical protein